MIQVPKFQKDTTKYFQYEGSPNPTSQDDLQAFMKNQHATLNCLVDGLWQPETVYKEGQIVRSPNMQAGFVARVTKAGTSGSNEPDWGGATATDGTVEWKIQKQGSGGGGATWESSTFYNVDSTVSLEGNSSLFLLCIKSGTSGATQPTVSGESNITDGSVTWKPIYYKKIPVLDNSNYIKGENLAGYWKANELVQIGTVRYLQGDKYAGYFLKCTQSGTTGTTQPSPATTSITAFVDGGAKWELKQIPDKKEVMDSIPNISEYPSWYFDRGDGSDGVFNPSGATTISGVKNYTSVNIPSGVTVTVDKYAFIKCQGAFLNNGTINVNPVPNGGVGSTGTGIAGGNGNCSTGGAGADVVFFVGKFHGGTGGVYLNNPLESSLFINETTIGSTVYFGSGGGSGGGYTTADGAGSIRSGYGGGGGGSIVIIANTVQNNVINAKGQNGGSGSGGTHKSGSGGGGGGGVIAIVCNTITAQGTLSVAGGAGGKGGSGKGADGSDGIVFTKELGV